MRFSSGSVSLLREAVAGRESAETGRSAVLALLAASDRPPDSGDGERTFGDQHDAYDDAFEEAWLRTGEILERRARLRRAAVEQASQFEETVRVSSEEATRRLLGLDHETRDEAVRELIRRVDSLALVRPAEAIVLARAVAGAADKIGASARGAVSILRSFELRAHSWRSVAETAFRHGDLVAAERALALARTAFRETTLDPGLHGDLRRVEAEIRSDQSLFTEARRLAQQAVSLYRRAGDRRSEARATLSLAMKWMFEGETEKALEANDRGLALLDPKGDERLQLVAESNRVYWTNDLGRPAEARAALPRLRALAERHGHELDRFRYDWLEARILVNEGHPEEAAALYRAVLDRALELDLTYESATLAFELSIVLLELGRVTEVYPLAESVSRIFAAQGVAPEAAAALLLAAESLREGAAADEVLRLLRSKERSVRGR